LANAEQESMINAIFTRPGKNGHSSNRLKHFLHISGNKKGAEAPF
jgi:hypothetical protein